MSVEPARSHAWLDLVATVVVPSTITAIAFVVLSRALGIRIAIDDFGTGYSSLSYLPSFPIDFLKIDRSFVNELGRESNDQGRALVRSIISIGHNLKLAVIAEGIENSDQLGELLAAHCDFGQGFLLGYPPPPHEIREILVRRGKSSEVESAQTVS